MAPPPEYDKEPKAPDKNVTTACSDDLKVLYTIVKDQQQNPDHKGTATTPSAEAENNKDVETLDDGQLRALLDEAITYKCPKDREGKSSLFKELLHEVEQDDQACEAARGLSAGRGGRRGARGRRELQSNSLQDLVAAMAAEPAPRRPRNHPPAQVSARAHHGGSLPSGVDTSFLLSEEPPTGPGGYLATVRCVNPPPLAERRVSASDAHAPSDVDLLTRRSKPTFPMTYTARATLEIGSGSVCSGRAVTTTTASNQVRTTPVTAPRNPRRSRRDNPDRFDQPSETQHMTAPPVTGLKGQMKLMNAMCPKKQEEKQLVDGGGIHEDANCSNPKGDKNGVPRGQHKRNDSITTQRNKSSNVKSASKHDHINQQWVNSVHNWYDSLDNMKPLLNSLMLNQPTPKIMEKSVSLPLSNTLVMPEARTSSGAFLNEVSNLRENINNHSTIDIDCNVLHNLPNACFGKINNSHLTELKTKAEKIDNISPTLYKSSAVYDNNITDNDIILRKEYRERVGYDLVPPHSLPASPKYFKNVTIGLPSTALLESNQLFNKSTNASKTNNIKNLTLPQCNVSTSYSQDDEVCSSYASCIDSSTLKISEKAGKRHVGKEEISFQNDVIEIEKSELNSVHMNQFHNTSESKTSVSDYVKLLTSSAPIDYECNNILGTEYENTEVLCNVESNENHTKCESKTSSAAALTTHNLNRMFTLETDTADLKKKYHDGKQKEGNEHLELHCIEFKDTLNKYKVAGLDSVILPTSTYSTDQDSNIILNSDCETKDTTWENEIELADIPLCKQNVDHSEDFLQHLAVQQMFLKNLENNNSTNDYLLVNDETKHGNQLITVDNITCENIETVINNEKSANKELITVKENIVELKENIKEKFIFAELPNNAYVFLTLPQSFFNNDTTKEIENNNNVTPYTSGENNTVAKRSKTKSKHKKDLPGKNVKDHDVVNKSALKLLLYSNSSEKSLATSGLSLNCNKEVDSAIPFTCITTPEVVASCNTTSSTPQAAVAVDPKPLQLGSCYRAVSSLTGTWEPAADPVDPAPPAVQPDPAAELQQPRSVISSSFNGLPLSRPNYGSTATSATEEYKKSLDENGNAVQGFSSPLSGSSQQKKPRRKKSTKNETVIKSHQIDGYQGNKDINEVLRFIESNADTARGHKPGRAKHKDDCEDKGKKRSSSRKDKENKAKRASSLEELSRTKLEDLTATQPRAPPAKPERRSWGEDARDAFYLREPDAAELTDFQTVTKKRKPRRRADDTAADPPRRPRAPSPRPAPSDRSNDSNDDLDSVHSLPATRAPPAPHASYADIARTRHNIPDLIESCNFYAEGETRETRAPPPADADYPALAARRRKQGAPATRAAPRKERTEPPAPDVVSDRRPPVVLLDSTARPRDMDGVTFGFDVNEQLLGAAPRRGGARCDLLRDTEDGVPVAVPAGGAALRYVPPPHAPHLHHLHRIVDYVGAAWEDVLRCGGGKVRYFSE